MIKFYDTCALLNNIEVFKSDENFIISSITLKELENIKSSHTKDEETKYKARRLIHLLSENRDKYTVCLYDSRWDTEIEGRNWILNDDSRIIWSAYKTYFEKTEEDLVFITEDLLCAEMARNHTTMNVEYAATKIFDEYCGYIIIETTEAEMANFYSDILPNNTNVYNLLENQYLLIIDSSNNIIVDKYKWTKEGYVKVNYLKFESRMFGKVGPKDGDDYQQLALDSLKSNQITMIRGAAGTGKSYLAFGYMFHLLERGEISKIIIFCNTVATKGSAKLGFYPGSRTEKLLDSQIGNLLESKLGDRFAVEKLIEDGKLVLLPMSDIRGYDTTGMNAAIYISEAQNLDIELMRLALQRIGEDSICILDGDSDAQVDLNLYAGANNGMRRVSEVFRGQDFYGEVTLKNIKRSKIAQIAQKM